METIATTPRPTQVPIVPAAPAAGEPEENARRYSMSPRKVFALGLSVAIVVAVLSPVVQNWKRPPRDGFPLSYYPMFTEKRGETERCTYMVGLDASGKRYPLRYKLVRWGGGLNSVRRQINRLVQKGQADELSHRIAARVAASKKPPYSQIVAVEIVTGTYSLNEYFTGKSKAPLKEIVHARCDVERSGP